MRLLLTNLFKTFIIANVLAVTANCIYYSIAVHWQSYNYKNIVSQITGNTFMLTVILLIMALPMLFLAATVYWDNIWTRLFLYFGGSAAFAIAVLSFQMKPTDKIFDLITASTFLIVQVTFYYKTVKTTSITRI